MFKKKSLTLTEKLMDAALRSKSLDEYEILKKKILKRENRFYFFKDKLDSVKNFVKDKYDSVREASEQFDDFLKNKYVSQILGVGLMSAIMINGINYNNNRLIEKLNRDRDELMKSEQVSQSGDVSFENRDKGNFEDLSKNYLNVNGVLVDKEFSKQDLSIAAKKRGLTGILNEISSENSSYFEGGNIHVLAKIAGIDLFDENVSIERGKINLEYVGNGINDMLSEGDVDKIYDYLTNVNHSDELRVDKKLAKKYDKKREGSGDICIESVRDFSSLDNRVFRDVGEIKEAKYEVEPKPENWPVILNGTRYSPQDYVQISNIFSSSRNKSVALDKIASLYSVSVFDASDAVVESRLYVGVGPVKYSAFLKNSFSNGDAANFLEMYLTGSVKEVKKQFKEDDLDFSSNFYRAVDDFSKKLGFDNIRKSKLSSDDKKELVAKLRKYA